MLIQPDKWKLGDGLLNKEQALRKSYEDTEKSVARYRLDDHEELKNMEKRMGMPMLANDLINKITKLNPRVWAEDSLANPTTVVGFYYTNNEGKKACAVPFLKGALPEFSFILVDAADLPVKEVRGWRTVLHRLLKLRLITWKDVITHFGDTLHSADDRWKANTQEFRA